MKTMRHCVNQLFLTTRETFPGQKSFSQLCRDFFGKEDPIARAGFIKDGWSGKGLLVHMANPEQIDDLLSHIDRKGSVRFLSTSYIHTDFRPTVYAIGRGTGIILDGEQIKVDHISMTDSDTVTDPVGKLVVSDHAKLGELSDLHEVLKARPSEEWNEVNVSFRGAGCIKGFFSLDGIMSKLYATALHLKSCGLLPVFTYNKERNELMEFMPTHDVIAGLIDQVPVPELRDRYGVLLDEMGQK